MAAWLVGSATAIDYGRLPASLAPTSTEQSCDVRTLHFDALRRAAATEEDALSTAAAILAHSSEPILLRSAQLDAWSSNPAALIRDLGHVRMDSTAGKLLAEGMLPSSEVPEMAV